MRSLVLSLFVFMQISAHADVANDTLQATVKSLMTILEVPDQPQRVQQLCQLVNTGVDLPTIANTLLGPTFATLARDADGIAKFNALMPSIIVSDFYSLVSNKAGAPYKVDTAPIPKGSTKVGYKVDIGGTVLTITVTKAAGLILDAEFGGLSLIQTKTDQFQRDLQDFLKKDPTNSLPVTELVNKLVNSGNLIRCN